MDDSFAIMKERCVTIPILYRLFRLHCREIKEIRNGNPLVNSSIFPLISEKCPTFFVSSSVQTIEITFVTVVYCRFVE